MVNETTLIRCPVERKRAQAVKLKKLLTFLKEETFSNFETLNYLLGYKTPQTLYKLLAYAERNELIKKLVIPVHGVNLALWGITAHGAALTLEEGEMYVPKEFSARSISPARLTHTFLNQTHRVLLQKAGAYDWRHGDRPAFSQTIKLDHRPDAVFSYNEYTRIALETERTLKAPARYKSIMASHLYAMQGAAGRAPWTFTFYVCPNDKIRTALRRIFDSIQQVTVNKTPVKLESKHRLRFRFHTTDELRAISHLKELVPKSG